MENEDYNADILEQLKGIRNESNNGENDHKRLEQYTKRGLSDMEVVLSQTYFFIKEQSRLRNCYFQTSILGLIIPVCLFLSPFV